MHLTGLNIDPRQLAAAEAQTKAANGNHIAWVEADACQLPFEDNSFDRVVAVECIFHFPSREHFLAEATRVLKPGGYLAVSDFVPIMAFFGKTPIWMAIRSRIAKSYGTLGKVPLRSYKAMGKRAGLQLETNRNIRKNTLPTYLFLIKFFRELGSADAQKTTDRGDPMDEMAVQIRPPSVPGVHVPQTCLTVATRPISAAMRSGSALSTAITFVDCADPNDVHRMPATPRPNSPRGGST